MVSLSAISVLADDSLEVMERDLILTEKNPVGTEYYITFLKNYRKRESSQNQLTMKLFITALKDANVVIEIPEIQYRRDLFIPANETKSYSMPEEAQLLEFGKVQTGKSIHITSDQPIYVYGLSTRTQTTDSYLAFPTSVLGDEYRLINYKATSRVVTRDASRPEFCVIAVEDSTEVEIIPTANLTNSTKSGDTLRLFLNRGDTYQATVHDRQGRNVTYPDLTGTLIKTSKPSAVFSGHECSFVPNPSTSKRNTCNHLIEQVPPVSSWGKHFCLGMFAKRSSYVFRVLAHQDSTVIFINNKKNAMLMAGEYIEKRVKEDLTISADKPVLVAQYSEGYSNGDNIGDPMMLYVSPTNQFLDHYYFSTPNDGDWYHYINIVVPTRSINAVRIDGKTLEYGTIRDDTIVNNNPVHLIDTTPEEYIKNLGKDKTGKFRKLGNSRYSVASFPIAYGPHEITCSAPFGMYSYGFGTDFDAYGTMGGQSFKEYVYVPDKEAPYAEFMRTDSGYYAVLYDDREDDSGLMEISSIENDNIDISQIDLVPGIPYEKIEIIPVDENLPGRARLFAMDVEGNVKEYTICYIYNNSADKFVMEFNEGYQEFCAERRFEIGLFLNPQIQMHKTDFQNSGDIFAPSKFSDDTESALGFGIYGSMKIRSRVNIAMKLFMDKTKASLTAAYPNPIQVRNPITGELDDAAESYRLDMDALFLHYNAELEYFINRHLYLKGGLGMAVNVSEDSRLTRYLIDPSYGYPEKNILSGETNAVKPMALYTTGGVGFTTTLPLFNEYLSLFSEILYTYNFNDYIKKGDWHYNTVTFNLGLKYSL
jgi:hypothetical protein